MQKNALEKSKYFPYMAWATIIGFSVFVFSLVMNLQAVAKDLRESTDNLESAVKGLPTTSPQTASTTKK